MRDRELSARILGFSAPWQVTDRQGTELILDVSVGTVEVFVEHRGQTSCPKCGKPCAGDDARRRRWRHIHTRRFQT
jgi:transposase